MEEVVIVWGKPHTVRVAQKSKSVWTASGEYMGEHIQTTGATAGAAIKRWREAAQYRGG